jgi:hypothetical protein
MSHNNTTTISYWEFEALKLQDHKDYADRCRDPQSYRALGDAMQHWQSYPLMSRKHLAARGNYSLYPDRLVSFPQERSGEPVFVPCANCARPHCSDAWLPFGYCSLWDRVTMVGDGSPERPYLYYCRDAERCVKSGGGGGPLSLQLNYRCNYARSH